MRWVVDVETPISLIVIREGRLAFGEAPQTKPGMHQKKDYHGLGNEDAHWDAQ